MNFQPDVLIGADHYWDLMTGETIRGDKGPVAVYTHLGGSCLDQLRQMKLPHALQILLSMCLVPVSSVMSQA